MSRNAQPPDGGGDGSAPVPIQIRNGGTNEILVRFPARRDLTEIIAGVAGATWHENRRYWPPTN